MSNDDAEENPIANEAPAAGKIGAFTVTNNNIPIPIEDTPLGRARKAIDLARQDVIDAIEEWENDGPPYDGNCPGGEYEITLRPDGDSFGFELLIEYGDSVGDPAEAIAKRLAPVLRAHGIATVSVVGTNLDSASVKEGE